MMKKTHRQEGHGRPDNRKLVDVRFDPTINEGPLTLAVMEKKIVRLRDTVRRQEGEISTLRQLLINQDVVGHWEVPG